MHKSFLAILNRLVEKGIRRLAVIEHNLDVVKMADVSPEGGHGRAHRLCGHTGGGFKSQGELDGAVFGGGVEMKIFRVA